MPKIVFFTGAGVSAESGVPTFRGKDGVWQKVRVEDVATPEGFFRDPAKVWEWYDRRRAEIKKAKPNEAHVLMAKLERELEDVWVITQNIDNLHKEAGSEKVIELHGNIWRVRCLHCGALYYEYEVPLESYPPKCKHCGGMLRPDVVWFGEPLPLDALQRAWEISRDAKIFVVVGTSGLVYPAAQLPYEAKRGGAYVIEINPEVTPISSIADEVFRQEATSGMRRFYEDVRKGKYSNFLLR